MNIDTVSKAIAEIKPEEVRLPAWVKLLKGMWLNEQAMLNSAREANPAKLIKEVATLKLPQVLELIPKIEKELTLIKKTKTETEDNRKKYTKPLNDYIERLMISEKAYVNYAAHLSKFLLELKKVEQTEIEKTRERENELATFKRDVQINFNSDIAEQERYISDKISEAYSNALDNIEVDALSSYLDELRWSMQEHRFVGPSNKFEDKEKQEIANSIYQQWDAKGFSNKFSDRLTETFMDFALSKGKKEEAKKLHEMRSKAVEEEVEENLQIENATAGLEAKTTKPTISLSGGKKLKQVYVLDMEKNEANMALIIRAFYGNYVACMQVIRRSDPWSIDINAMAMALTKMKNADSQLKLDKITFKQESVL